MNLLDAAYNTVHDYPGGAQVIAARMGKNPNSLSHELTSTGTAKLGLLDALKITQLTGDKRILESFAANTGFTLVPVSHGTEASPMDCMKNLANLVQEFGALCTEVSMDLTDQQITDNELARIDRESLKVIGAVHALRESLAARNDACRGKSLRRAA